MNLNWTTILAGTIPAVINSLAIFFATRYAGHLVARIEKRAGINVSVGDKTKDGDK